MIELMVGLAIMGMLFLMAMPSINGYLANSKIRAAAQTYYSGVQLARSEAVRLNKTVQILLTEDEPTAAKVATAAVNATGRNWIVRVAEPDGTFTFIQGKSMQEGGAASVGVTAGAAGDKDRGLLAFGNLSTATNITAPVAVDFFLLPDNTSCIQSGGEKQCLRVMVSPGGQARVCDPTVTADTDNRKC